MLAREHCICPRGGVASRLAADFLSIREVLKCGLVAEAPGKDSGGVKLTSLLSAAAEGKAIIRRFLVLAPSVGWQLHIAECQDIQQQNIPRQRQVRHAKRRRQNKQGMFQTPEIKYQDSSSTWPLAESVQSQPHTEKPNVFQPGGSYP